MGVAAGLIILSWRQAAGEFPSLPPSLSKHCGEVWGQRAGRCWQEPEPGLEEEPGWAAVPIAGSNWKRDLESLDVGQVQPLAFRVQGPGSY